MRNPQLKLGRRKNPNLQGVGLVLKPEVFGFLVESEKGNLNFFNGGVLMRRIILVTLVVLLLVGVNELWSCGSKLTPTDADSIEFGLSDYKNGCRLTLDYWGNPRHVFFADSVKVWDHPDSSGNFIVAGFDSAVLVFNGWVYSNVPIPDSSGKPVATYIGRELGETGSAQVQLWFRSKSNPEQWTDFTPLVDVQILYHQGHPLDDPQLEYTDRIASQKVVIKCFTVPVELCLFEANVDESDVILNWVTASETNNYGFEVQRRFKDTGDWEVLDFVCGHGTTSTPQKYYYYDKLVSGEWDYRLKQIDYNGSYEFSPITTIELKEVIPSSYRLYQNYPNPFNPTTTIRLELPKATNVRLMVFSVAGQLVASLVNGQMTAGSHEILWDAINLPSGIYFCRINAGSFRSCKKMNLIK